MTRSSSTSLSEVDAVILCGGLGTRLQPLISDKPKGLAPIQGRPFLDILVDDLIRQGLRRIIFCVGHLKEQIIDHYRARHDAQFEFAVENEPLGTGGAVHNALPLVRTNRFLVANGDSRCAVNLNELLEFHDDHAADATLVLVPAIGREDTGAVQLDSNHRLVSFSGTALSGNTQGYTNAGIYLFRRDVEPLTKRHGTFSLEYDVFPELANGGKSYGFVVDAPLVDIGTPERYHQANLGHAEEPR